jgi:hypothetical protein
MSSTEGFAILKNWQTFKSDLSHFKLQAPGADWPVTVIAVSEAGESVVLEFAGVQESTDLSGAEFKEIPPEEVRDELLISSCRFLEIRFPDGSNWLLAESRLELSGEPIN